MQEQEGVIRLWILTADIEKLPYFWRKVFKEKPTSNVGFLYITCAGLFELSEILEAVFMISNGEAYMAF